MPHLLFCVMFSLTLYFALINGNENFFCIFSSTERFFKLLGSEINRSEKKKSLNFSLIYLPSEELILSRIKSNSGFK